MRSYRLEVVRGILDQDLVGVRERPGSGLSILINFNHCCRALNELLTSRGSNMYRRQIRFCLTGWLRVIGRQHR